MKLGSGGGRPGAESDGFEGLHEADCGGFWQQAGGCSEEEFVGFSRKGVEEGAGRCNPEEEQLVEGWSCNRAGVEADSRCRRPWERQVVVC